MPMMFEQKNAAFFIKSERQDVVEPPLHKLLTSGYKQERFDEPYTKDS